MYDLIKRAYISTLGELRELLAELPDDTEILACGSSDAWLHFEKDNSLVSLDYADLDDGTVYLELEADGTLTKLAQEYLGDPVVEGLEAGVVK